MAWVEVDDGGGGVGVAGGSCQVMSSSDVSILSTYTRNGDDWGR